MADHSPARRAVGRERGARRTLAVAGTLAALVLAGCGTPGTDDPARRRQRLRYAAPQAASSPGGAGSQEPGSASPTPRRPVR